jgi:intermediate filament protein if
MQNGKFKHITKIYPIAQAKQVIIHRQSPIASFTSSNSNTPSGTGANADPELIRLHMNVGERIEGRGKQKEQMNELNERLADYVEKVRFLDAQNRRLNRELDVLRERYGRETDHVRAMFQCEVQNMEELLRQSEADREKAQEQLTAMEEELNSLENGVNEVENENRRNQELKDRLNQQLADMEGEIALLKRQAGAFDTVRKRNKEEISRLRNEENRLKKDLENEIQGKFKAELEAEYLKDMMDAIESNHLMKWQEFANTAYKDSSDDTRSAWSSEFKQKFKQIRDAYDERVNEIASEVNETMSLKLRQNIGAVNRGQLEVGMLKQEYVTLSNRLNELQNRINNLNFQITQSEMEIDMVEQALATAKKEKAQEMEDLEASLMEKRRECDYAKEELQKFFDMKLSTEVELAAYKKLMDSEVVHETIDFVDSGKFQTTYEQTEIPRYYSTTQGTYVGGGI